MICNRHCRCRGDVLLCFLDEASIIIVLNTIYKKRVFFFFFFSPSFSVLIVCTLEYISHPRVLSLPKVLFGPHSATRLPVALDEKNPLTQ